MTAAKELVTPLGGEFGISYQSIPVSTTLFHSAILPLFPGPRYIIIIIIIIIIFLKKSAEKNTFLGFLHVVLKHVTVC